MSESFADPTRDRRRADRVPLQSQVAVTHFESVHQLRVANASATGLFLEVDDLDDLPEFSIGAEVNVRLFDEALGEDSDVLAMARVVRVVQGRGVVVPGIALRFVEIGEGDQDRLMDLLKLRGLDRSTLAS